MLTSEFCSKRLAVLLAVAMSVILLSAFMAGCGAKTQDTAPNISKTESTASQGDWAVCAYDGMVMKKAGMGATEEHGGKKFYFCNEAHKNSFIANPDKYLRTWEAFGNNISFNVLTIDEYVASMQDMGMKMEAPSDVTHYITLNAMDPEAIPMKDFAAQVSLAAPSGEILEYVLPLAKNSKQYETNVNLSESGEYQIEVSLEYNHEKETNSFPYTFGE